MSVFPTCVGVSPEARKELFFKRSSPRAWGCFFYASADKTNLIVFPTCVGVFLKE